MEQVIKNNRRTGRTTRKVDKAIQHLFTKKELVIYDDYHKDSDFCDHDAKKHYTAERYFINILLSRLRNEHRDCYTTEKIKDRIIIRC